MKTFPKIAVLIAALLSPMVAGARDDGNDVFVPITKYISQADVESLSVWFADNLELSVLSEGRIASRDQAKLVLSRFFRSNTPRSMRIDHTTSSINMKTALGTLNAGGEDFTVTIFVTRLDDTYRIRQLKIERRL